MAISPTVLCENCKRTSKSPPAPSGDLSRLNSADMQPRSGQREVVTSTDNNNYDIIICSYTLYCYVSLQPVPLPGKLPNRLVYMHSTILLIRNKTMDSTLLRKVDFNICDIGCWGFVILEQMFATSVSKMMLHKHVIQMYHTHHHKSHQHTMPQDHSSPVLVLS